MTAVGYTDERSDDEMITAYPVVCIDDALCDLIWAGGTWTADPQAFAAALTGPVAPGSPASAPPTA